MIQIGIEMRDSQSIEYIPNALFKQIKQKKLEKYYYAGF
jgi:hypothetical protein